jgi:hypothetical protein
VSLVEGRQTHSARGGSHKTECALNIQGILEIKLTVFWDVAPCSLVYIISLWWWQWAPLKLQLVSARVHGTTSQNTAIFILVAMRTWNLTDIIHSVHRGLTHSYQSKCDSLLLYEYPIDISLSPDPRQPILSGITWRQVPPRYSGTQIWYFT